MHDQSDIKSLDFEWNVYRKGSLHAYLHLEKRYMTWRDSAQWCNNFTRTLSDEQADLIQKLILTSGLIEMQPDKVEEKTTIDEASKTRPVSWQVKIQVDETVFQTQGFGAIPEQLLPLKEQIERIGHTCLIL